VNLTTHFVFGAFVAAVFTRLPSAVVLVALGSLIPDLDREYWFWGRERFKEDQVHRSLFHNVFVILILYFISPWISLGVFLHSLLDSLTTVKDRGVEWLYPLSRAVKRGANHYECSRSQEKCEIDLKELPEAERPRVCYLQEDPKELTKHSSSDLTESREAKPIPWSRTYGPAANGEIVDWTIFFGSVISLLVFSLLWQPGFLPGVWVYVSSRNYVVLIYLLLLAFLFLFGEIGRIPQKAVADALERSEFSKKKVSKILDALTREGKEASVSTKEIGIGKEELSKLGEIDAKRQKLYVRVSQIGLMACIVLLFAASAFGYSTVNLQSIIQQRLLSQTFLIIVVPVFAVALVVALLFRIVRDKGKAEV
jgi:hypothetical protein